MITIDQYFYDTRSHWGEEPTSEQLANASDLLERVSVLEEKLGLDFFMTSGHRCRKQSLHLIEKGYKAAINGKHESANAIDLADGKEELDNLLTDEILEQVGLYREDPQHTPGWCHVQNVPPHSQHRTFIP